MGSLKNAEKKRIFVWFKCEIVGGYLYIYSSEEIWD